MVETAQAIIRGLTDEIHTSSIGPMLRKLLSGLGWLALIPPFWKACVWAVDWFGRTEIVTHIASLAWVAPVIAFLNAIPPWVSLLLLLVGFGLLWLRSRRTEEPKITTQVASTEAAQPERTDRLTPLAESDEQEMNSRLCYMNRDTTMNGQLGAVEPYVDIRYWFINASVFTPELVRIEGRMQFLGSDLQSKPDILDPQTVPPTKRIIRHGETRVFVVRQWLTRDTANRMLAGDGGANPTEGKFGINSGQVAMVFIYENMSGEKKEVRKGI